ncbi:MAG TPA: L,D-transpeptidase [Gemmatimonadaceae bacterium]|jgi:lipoprotein-anchoring transpeptidase ErfK/SrfK|nr:L,D-transpeptidase [Gemmatimonadaceae bacterium]
MSFTQLNKRFAAAAVLAAIGAASFGAARSATAAPAVSNDDPGTTVLADLSQRKLYIKSGDSVVETFNVAVGKGSKPTPQGNYTIKKIVWNPAWIPPDEPWAKGKSPQAPGAKANPMKLVKIFFHEPDYYIHGTGDVESLGEAASHGCLRMDPDDAYRVARYLMDHGGKPQDESWFWRVLHFRSETKTVYLDHGIPMTVTD